MSGEAKDPADSAEAIFAAWLTRVEAGEDPDLESLLKAHPEHTEALRRLHDDWKLFAPLLGRAVPGRMEDGHGIVLAPLSGSSAEAGEPPSRELLERLGIEVPQSGRYRFRSVLGRGGGGIVLKVWDAKLNRPLAMKIVMGRGEERPTGDTPKVDGLTLTRFVDEARITSQLNHPGIVPVHELGLDESGRAFFTMKLVRGEELGRIFEHVRTGHDGWNQTRALNVLLRVCESVAFAHEKGVIHRDLKPANVMVGRHGEVYVTDWGLARVLGEQDHKDVRVRPPAATSALLTTRAGPRTEGSDSPLYTMDGDVVGTPAYMSLEQAAGDLARMGPHSDVYAVGAMLYHLLTGQMPYVPPGARLNNYAVWQRVQEGPPTLIESIAPRAPVELVAICEKAMAREGGGRYPSMQVLAEDLRAFIEGRVVAAHETGAWAETKKWVRRNRALAVSAMTIVIILMCGGIGLYISGRQARVSALEALWSAYVANIRAADLAEEGGQQANLSSYLEKAPQSLRGWEWSYLNARRDNRIGVIRTDAPIRAYCFEPEGSVLTTASADGEVTLWDTATLQKQRVFSDRVRSVSLIAFVREGRELLAANDAGEFWLWNIVDGSLLHHFQDNAAAKAEWALDSSGKRLLRISGVRATLWDLGVGTALGNWTSLDLTPLEECTFDPTGNRFLLRSSTTITIHASNDGMEVGSFAATDPITETAWSSNGALLAVLRGPQLAVWDVEGGTRAANLTITGGPAWTDRRCSFSANAEVLTYAGESTISLWSLASDGAENTLVFDHQVWGILPPSDDSRLIVWGSETIHVIDMLTGETLHDLRTRNLRRGMLVGCTTSHDGQYILGIYNNAAPVIWHATSGEVVTTLTGNESPISGFEHSPRGELLAAHTEDGSISLWWLAGPEFIQSSRQDLHFASEGVGFLSRAGQIYTTTGSDVSASDECLDIWSAISGRRLHTIDGHAIDEPSSLGGWFRVKRSPDARRMVTSTHADDVRLWDSATGIELSRLPPVGEHGPPAVAFGPEDALVCAGRLGVLEVYGGHQKFLPIDGMAALEWPLCAYSPDGRWIAIGGGDGSSTRDSYGRLVLWNRHAAQSTTLIEGNTGSITSIAFTADGGQLGCLYGDGRVQVWRTNPIGLTAEWQASTLLDTWASCQFTPKGRNLAIMTGGLREGLLGTPKEPSLCLWDPRTRRPVQAFFGHWGPVLGAWWFPKASRVLTYSDDWTSRIWDVSTGEELVRLRGMAAPHQAEDGELLIGTYHSNVLVCWDSRSKRDRYLEYQAYRLASARGEETLSEALFETKGLVEAGQWLRDRGDIASIVRQVALDLLLQRCQVAKEGCREKYTLVSRHQSLRRLLDRAPWSDDGHEQPDVEPHGSSRGGPSPTRSLVDPNPSLPTLAIADAALVGRAGVGSADGATGRSRAAWELFWLGCFDEAIEVGNKAVEEATVAQEDVAVLQNSLDRLKREIAKYRDETGALRRDVLLEELETLERRIAELEADPWVQRWIASQRVH